MLQGFYDIFWICVNWGHLDNVDRHETFQKCKEKTLPFLLQLLLCKRTLCTFYFNFINLGVWTSLYFETIFTQNLQAQ